MEFDVLVPTKQEEESATQKIHFHSHVLVRVYYPELERECSLQKKISAVGQLNQDRDDSQPTICESDEQGYEEAVRPFLIRQNRKRHAPALRPWLMKPSTFDELEDEQLFATH